MSRECYDFWMILTLALGLALTVGVSLFHVFLVQEGGSFEKALDRSVFAGLCILALFGAPILSAVWDLVPPVRRRFLR